MAQYQYGYQDSSLLDLVIAERKTMCDSYIDTPIGNYLILIKILESINFTYDVDILFTSNFMIVYFY